MANTEHLELLSKGVHFWNKWKKENSVKPDLSGANIEGLNLSKIDLSNSNLQDIDLTKCNLSESNFSSSNLSGAYLINANLYKSTFDGANLYNVKLNYAELYDASFKGASLIEADVSNANLEKADFSGAKLDNALLIDAKLTKTNFTEATLKGANLSLAVCVETIFTNSNISGARIYGVSAWGLLTEGLQQSNLIVSRASESVITTDSIEVAQLIYLIINNKTLRDVIGTISKKGVLILGRFHPEERKNILEAIRVKLRENDFVPIMFDFEKAVSRDFTETIKILAAMSRFVIADITNPKSSPLELQATVPDYEIPFVTIIQSDETPFSMFDDLKKYPWVLPPMSYSSEEALLKGFKKGILDIALEKEDELIKRKQTHVPTRDADDYADE